MTTKNDAKTGTEGNSGDTATKDSAQSSEPTELDTLKQTAAALSKQVATLTADITAKDKELAKWQKKGKERDADVDNKAAEGDSAAWQKKLDDQRTEFAEKEEAYKGQISTLEGKLKHEMVKTPAVAKAAEYFNADALPLIQLLIEKHCDLEDGEIVVRDDQGKVRYSPDSARNKMSIDEFLKELAKKHPSAAKAKGASGTDSGTGKKTTTGANSGKSYAPEEILRAPLSEQNKMIAEGDVDSARRFLKSVSGGGSR